eukprot:Skav210383  [mRNA]  locus=scaffold1526:228634:234144:- [translate_table: standard]
MPVLPWSSARLTSGPLPHKAPMTGKSLVHSSVAKLQPKAFCQGSRPGATTKSKSSSSSGKPKSSGE